MHSTELSRYAINQVSRTVTGQAACTGSVTVSPAALMREIRYKALPACLKSSSQVSSSIRVHRAPSSIPSAQGARCSNKQHVTNMQRSLPNGAGEQHAPRGDHLAAPALTHNVGCSWVAFSQQRAAGHREAVCIHRESARVPDLPQAPNTCPLAIHPGQRH